MDAFHQNVTEENQEDGKAYWREYLHGKNGIHRKVGLGNFPVVTVILIALNVFVYIAVEPFVGSLLLPYWAWPVMATFLHAGLLHLATNMVSLWILGSMVEREESKGRFLAVYLGAGIGGELLTIFIPTGNWSFRCHLRPHRSLVGHCLEEDRLRGHSD